MKTLILLAVLALTFACSDDANGGTDNNGTQNNGGGSEDCEVVQGGLIDRCPGEQRCVQTSDTTAECFDSCFSKAECADGQDCYDFYNDGTTICETAKPICPADATEAECECDFDDGTSAPIFRVSGTGDECVIVERNQTACYTQWFDRRSCERDPVVCSIKGFYRYELGNGEALIIQADLAELTEGWISEGNGTAPVTCPILGGEF